MNECRECEKSYECFMENVDPCKKLIAWEELNESDRIQTEYRAKGIVLDWASGGNNHNPTGRSGK